MSISSCPRCAKQVTLPVNVDDHATVRCPLCHAQFPLSEALVNAPPLLEVIENLAEGVPAEESGQLIARRDRDIAIAAFVETPSFRRPMAGVVNVDSRRAADSSDRKFAVLLQVEPSAA